MASFVVSKDLLLLSIPRPIVRRHEGSLVFYWPEKIPGLMYQLQVKDWMDRLIPTQHPDAKIRSLCQTSETVSLGCIVVPNLDFAALPNPTISYKLLVYTPVANGQSMELVGASRTSEMNVRLYIKHGAFGCAQDAFFYSELKQANVNMLTSFDVPLDCQLYYTGRFLAIAGKINDLREKKGSGEFRAHLGDDIMQVFTLIKNLPVLFCENEFRRRLMREIRVICDRACARLIVALRTGIPDSTSLQVRLQILLGAVESFEEYFDRNHHVATLLKKSKSKKREKFIFSHLARWALELQQITQYMNPAAHGGSRDDKIRPRSLYLVLDAFYYAIKYYLDLRSSVTVMVQEIVDNHKVEKSQRTKRKLCAFYCTKSCSKSKGACNFAHGVHDLIGVGTTHEDRNQFRVENSRKKNEKLNSTADPFSISKNGSLFSYDRDHSPQQRVVKSAEPIENGSKSQFFHGTKDSAPLNLADWWLAKDEPDPPEGSLEMPKKSSQKGMPALGNQNHARSTALPGQGERKKKKNNNNNAYRGDGERPFDFARLRDGSFRIECQETIKLERAVYPGRPGGVLCIVADVDNLLAHERVKVSDKFVQSVRGKQPYIGQIVRPEMSMSVRHVRFFLEQPPDFEVMIEPLQCFKKDKPISPIRLMPPFDRETFKPKKVCRHFQKGHCRFGTSCKFRHIKAESLSAASDVFDVFDVLQEDLVEGLSL